MENLDGSEGKGGGGGGWMIGRGEAGGEGDSSVARETN